MVGWEEVKTLDIIKIITKKKIKLIHKDATSHSHLLTLLNSTMTMCILHILYLILTQIWQITFVKFNKNNSITLQEKPYVEPLQEINANILVSQTEFLMKLISLKKALYWQQEFIQVKQFHPGSWKELLIS